MKILLTAILLGISVLTIQAQIVQLKFTTFEKYLTQNYTLEKIKTALSKNYSLVKQGETEWKFRDDSKSWEALVYVQFDMSTRKIKRIQFTAPENRVFEFMDELKKTLGYNLIGTEDKMDMYENKAKKLKAMIEPGDFIAPGIAVFQLVKM